MRSEEQNIKFILFKKSFILHHLLHFAVEKSISSSWSLAYFSVPLQLMGLRESSSLSLRAPWERVSARSLQRSSISCTNGQIIGTISNPPSCCNLRSDSIYHLGIHLNSISGDHVCVCTLLFSSLKTVMAFLCWTLLSFSLDRSLWSTSRMQSVSFTLFVRCIFSSAHFSAICLFRCSLSSFLQENKTHNCWDEDFLLHFNIKII